jgi:hypothetical protein
VRQPLDAVHQQQQLGFEAVDGAPGLCLVLQRALQPEQRDGGRMRVDLDGAPRDRRPRIEVQAQRRGQAARAGAGGEFGLSGVAGVGAGLVPAEIAVERGLGRALAGRVVHHQRRIEGDHAIALHVGAQRRQDLVVVADRAHAHQGAAGVHHRDAGRVTTCPRKVDAGEVHPHRLRARP